MSNFFSGRVRGAETGRVEKLNPAQEELVAALASAALPAIEQVQGATVPGQQFGPSAAAPLQQQAFGLAAGLPDLFGISPTGISEGFSPIAKFAQNQFQQETIPNIAAAAGFEGGARSSGFQNILAREGRNLNLGLASQLAGIQLGLPGQLAGIGGQQRQIQESQREFALQQFQAGAPEADPRLGFIGPAFTSAFDTTVQQGAFDPSVASQVLGPGASIIGAIAGSDERFKEDIETIENALDKVLTLDGKTYKYKAKDKERDAGVIAQDIEKVLPEAVIEDENGMKYVKYDAVLALLVNAVKELAGKVA